MFSFRSKKERAIDFQIRTAHPKSAYKDMPLEVFDREVRRLAQSNDGEIDFDDPFYLSANNDIARSIERGDYLCGYLHYCIFGQYEPRLWSTRHVTRAFGLKPRAGQDLFEPVHAHALSHYGPDLSALPLAAEPALLVFLPSLQEDLFFAGYSGFFADLKTVTSSFSRVIVVVLAPVFSPELAQRFDARIEVLALRDVGQLTERPSLVFCFDAETVHVANDVFGDRDRTIYYCQDFEAGFFPFGSSYVRAERAVYQARNIVLSTGLLRDFLAQRDLLTNSNVHVTAPVIHPIEVTREKKKRLFFYFRPERFNTRNMPELILDVVESFCQKYTGYEIFLCGAVGSTYSMRVHGTDVTVLSKLAKSEYEALLGSCDAVVAMIYSAHPGVIAFQAAASGIPTVTNTFGGRDAAVLRSISDNLVPFDPIREDLLAKLEEALQMPKARPSFHAEVYGGRSVETFQQYVAHVLRGA